jgi:hypothetical protein
MRRWKDGREGIGTCRSEPLAAANTRFRHGLNPQVLAPPFYRPDGQKTASDFSPQPKLRNRFAHLDIRSYSAIPGLGNDSGRHASGLK